MADVTLKFKLDVVDNLQKSLSSITKSLSGLEKQVDSLNKSLNDVNKTQADKFNKNMEAIADNSANATKELSKLTFAHNGLSAALGGAAIAIGLTSSSVRTFLKGIDQTILKTVKFNSGLIKISNTARESSKLVGSLAKASIILDKGIFGVAINAATASTVLLGLSAALRESDNEAAQAASKLTFLGGIALGGLSFAISAVILKIGDLSLKLGSDLIKVTSNASQKFIELEKKTFIFKRTIDGFSKVFGPAIGTTEKWTKTIDALSLATGTTRKSLRAATSEIVATTSQMGFNERQMKLLLNVANDYAAQIGGDSLQATIDFISALNGSSRSVIKYGVKLNAASVQQDLFKKGIKGSFSSLSDNEKIQARFNALLSEYVPIAGVAADVAGTLSGQQKILSNNLTRLNTEFGRGAAFIENTNIAAFAVNSVLSKLNSTVVAGAGFITALGARILQIGGFLLNLSFKVLLVTKGLKLLNVLLSSKLSQSIINLPIPFLNKSLLDVIKSSGATFVSFRSLKDIFKTLASVFLATGKQMIASLLGIKVASLSVSRVIGVTLVKSFAALRTVVLAIGRATLALATNPFFLGIAAIVASVLLLRKAFILIEKQTGIFTTAVDILNNIWNETKSIIDPIIDLFAQLGEVIIRVASKAFGFFTLIVAEALKVVLLLASADPFGIFGKKNVAKLNVAVISLGKFQKKLVDINFDVRNLGKNVKKTTKTMGLDFKKFSIDQIANLENSLKDVGKTELQVLRDTLNKRKALIDGALAQGIISAKKSAILRNKIEIDFAFKAVDVRAKAEEETTKKLEEEVRKREEALKKFSDMITKISESPGAALVGIASGETPLTGATGTALVAGFGATALKGKEGASSLLVGGASEAANLLLPGLGPVVGQITEALLQGPDAVKGMVREFAASIPVLIEALVASLPVVIEELIRAIPAIITRIAERADVIVESLVVGLIEGAPRIISGLIRALPRLVFSLILLMPKVAAALIKSIIPGGKQFAGIISKAGNGFKETISSAGSKFKSKISDAGSKLGDIFSKIGSKLSEVFSKLGDILSRAGSKILEVFKQVPGIVLGAFKSVGNVLVDAGRKFFDKIVGGGNEFIKKILSKLSGGILGGGGGGGLLGSIPVIGGVLGSFGFAKGGIPTIKSVPAGFPGDTFGASLTSGELVVDRTTTNQLKDFLEANRGPQRDTQSGTTDVLLAKVIDLLQRPMNVDTSVNFNGRTMAEILLTLDRTNARTRTA